MNQGLPKISIITPCFNSAKTIESTMLSVANQTYPNIEHVIVDGKSRDNTVEIVTNFQRNHKHLVVVSEKDKGIYDAMNKGVALATGEWVMFLGSDDDLADNHVLSNIFEQEDLNKYDVMYGNVQLKNAGTKFSDEFTVELFSRFNIAHQAIFYRKSLFERLGNYSLKYVMFADYAFNFRWFGDATVKRKYVKQIISVFNEAGASSFVFDKEFYRDKAGYLVNYLHLNKTRTFADAMRYVIYDQIRGNDIWGAFKNLLITLGHADADFNRTLLVKEFISLWWKREKNS